MAEIRLARGAFPSEYVGFIIAYTSALSSHVIGRIRREEKDDALAPFRYSRRPFRYSPTYTQDLSKSAHWLVWSIFCDNSEL